MGHKFSEVLDLLVKYPKYDVSVLCFDDSKNEYIFETITDERKKILRLYDYKETRFQTSPTPIVESFLDFSDDYDFTIDESKFCIEKIKSHDEHFFIFIDANEVCETAGTVATLFSGQKQFLGSDITKTDINLHMKILEGFGLVFKRFHYYWKMSDFGDDNYIYEICANPKYTMMFDKPVIRVHIDPRGNIYSELSKCGIKSEIIGDFNLELAGNFYNGKKMICVNFDLVPQPEYRYDPWQISFGFKRFQPFTYRDCFKLTVANPTTDSFSDRNQKT